MFRISNSLQCKSNKRNPIVTGVKITRVNLNSVMDDDDDSECSGEEFTSRRHISRMKRPNRRHGLQIRTNELSDAETTPKCLMKVGNSKTKTEFNFGDAVRGENITQARQIFTQSVQKNKRQTRRNSKILARYSKPIGIMRNVSNSSITSVTSACTTTSSTPSTGTTTPVLYYHTPTTCSGISTPIISTPVISTPSTSLGKARSRSRSMSSFYGLFSDEDRIQSDTDCEFENDIFGPVSLDFSAPNSPLPSSDVRLLPNGTTNNNTKNNNINNNNHPHSHLEYIHENQESETRRLRIVDIPTPTPIHYNKVKKTPPTRPPAATPTHNMKPKVIPTPKPKPDPSPFNSKLLLFLDVDGVLITSSDQKILHSRISKLSTSDICSTRCEHNKTGCVACEPCATCSGRCNHSCICVWKKLGIQIAVQQLAFLKHLFFSTRCDIVISSSWQFYPRKHLPFLYACLEECGWNRNKNIHILAKLLNINRVQYEKTPYCKSRSLAIRDVVHKYSNYIRRWVVFDDLPLDSCKQVYVPKLEHMSTIVDLLSAKYLECIPWRQADARTVLPGIKQYVEYSLKRPQSVYSENSSRFGFEFESLSVYVSDVIAKLCPLTYECSGYNQNQQTYIAIVNLLCSQLKLFCKKYRDTQGDPLIKEHFIQTDCNLALTQFNIKKAVSLLIEDVQNQVQVPQNMVVMKLNRYHKTYSYQKNIQAHRPLKPIPQNQQN